MYKLTNQMEEKPKQNNGRKKRQKEKKKKKGIWKNDANLVS